MIKTFKHPKINIYATDPYTNDKGTTTYYVKFDGRMGERYEENLLIALGFEEIVPDVRHLGNGMIIGGDGCYINTTKTIKQYHRYETVDGDILSGCIDWSIFQTKEQAQNFDKMMMTVWKIWKWKKENDDKMDDSNYCLTLDKDNNEFFALEQCFVGDFFLPPFSSEEKVNQLISDLGEELNNLLCWIK